jgi:hypothetical protein
MDEIESRAAVVVTESNQEMPLVSVDDERPCSQANLISLKYPLEFVSPVANLNGPPRAVPDPAVKT